MEGDRANFLDFSRFLVIRGKTTLANRTHTYNIYTAPRRPTAHQKRKKRRLQLWKIAWYLHQSYMYTFIIIYLWRKLNANGKATLQSSWSWVLRMENHFWKEGKHNRHSLEYSISHSTGLSVRGWKMRDMEGVGVLGGRDDGKEVTTTTISKTAKPQHEKTGGKWFSKRPIEHFSMKPNRYRRTIGAAPCQVNSDMLKSPERFSSVKTQTMKWTK